MSLIRLYKQLNAQSFEQIWQDRDHAIEIATKAYAEQLQAISDLSFHDHIPQNQERNNITKAYFAQLETIRQKYQKAILALTYNTLQIEKYD